MQKGRRRFLISAAGAVASALIPKPALGAQPAASREKIGQILKVKAPYRFKPQMSGDFQPGDIFTLPPPYIPTPKDLYSITTDELRHFYLNPAIHGLCCDPMTED